MEDVDMDDKMDFVFRPSPQNSALTKMAVSLWTKDEVLALIPKTRDYVSAETNAARNMVRRNARLVPLSDQQRDQLSPYIWSVWTQMSQWYEYLYRHFGLRRINPPELRWTPQGTIDQKNSVLVLIRDRSLNAETRYRLACNYCLSDEIPVLMKDLSAETPMHFNNRAIAEKLPIFWTCHLNGQLAKLSQQRLPPALYAFQAAVFSCNAVAAEYLFENVLNAEEKETVRRKFSAIFSHRFDETIPEQFFPAMVCFLLSRLDGDGQMEVFRDYPKQMLRCFLVRPYHLFFVDTAIRMWGFISEKHFNALLFDIFQRVDYDYEVCEYRDLFCEFWNVGSVEHRKYVMEEGEFKSMLYDVLNNDEEEICGMMLAALDEGETAKLAVDVDLVECFYLAVIKHDKWNALDVFLSQCALAEETICEIKNVMIATFAKKVWVSESRKQNFFRILDENIIDFQPKKKKKSTTKKKRKFKSFRDC